MTDTTSVQTGALSNTDEVAEVADEVNLSTGELISRENQATQDEGALVIQDTINRLQSGQVNVISSVIGDDFQSRLKVLGAVTSSKPIMDEVEGKRGLHIDLQHYVIQAVQVTQRDEKGVPTGQRITQPRVILLDVNGTAFYGISPVLAKAVETYVGVLGQPHTWPDNGVPTRITREKSNNGFYFFNMVLDLEEGNDPRPVQVGKK